MNAIRTIENIPSGSNLRAIANYSPIGLGLFVYSLMLKNWLKRGFLELEKFVESVEPYTTKIVVKIRESY